MKIFFLLVFALQAFCNLAEEFKRVGYVEICEQKRDFDFLYAQFDAFVEFLQDRPVWARKLTSAKERFLRSQGRHYYSTDFFGLYNESKGRGQISFYYSAHFHEFLCSRYPEFSEVPEIRRFLDACFEMQQPCGELFDQAACEIGLKPVFVLFKVVKYLPSYRTTRPHYDGTAFSLLLDSTDDEALLLSPYKRSFVVDDFISPLRKRGSMLLIPGALLTEFSIDPTPHIVLGNGQVRYAAIAFAMRPNYVQPKTEHSPLPNFRR
jgi:hypothetical protein